ncbi:hypothetical protein CO048_02885 [Candidatus Roizmanbacteria bacterium CG_4_9_14_0_2_um_filter_35_15]|uniref:Glycosyl transferase family 1 domain-containing protein n=1 Tax=Candidatus Roizmanbacteria bacterium CG_4_9_14_0_2_um_filter_35_15 TaxID=1974836 RepID=A0A2M8F2Q7_9BACT|nr:MAG: hypothetical protein CO048_02885 [Candidatus Roizmanbacteria bacterium CG_4_9_14_0_2_um_filter_35_15]
MKKIGLYNPFLDTLGGGEKHILSIMDALAELGYEISIFWDKNLNREIRNRFAIRSVYLWKWSPNIFKHRSIGNRIFRLASLAQDDLKVTYDYFFYVTDGSYFFSSAKKNFVFAMVPDKKLYNLNLLNRLKLWNWQFISNSTFTQKWLKKWGVNSIAIPPYVDDKFFIDKESKKEKIILSVGRFFPHLHSKNQEKIIETFKLLKLSNPSFKDYKLILAGGLKKEDEEYFNQLKSVVRNDSSIIFKTNIPLYELYELYKLSNYFWHFTGLGVDENKHPEGVEHFGIAPLEAIASGCLTFCHSSGGPKDFVIEGETGFLFDNQEKLIVKMIAVEKNPLLQKKVKEKGRIIIKNRFSYQVFKEKVFELL